MPELNEKEFEEKADLDASLHLKECHISKKRITLSEVKKQKSTRGTGAKKNFKSTNQNYTLNIKKGLELKLEDLDESLDIKDLSFDIYLPHANEHFEQPIDR